MGCEVTIIVPTCPPHTLFSDRHWSVEVAEQLRLWLEYTPCGYRASSVIVKNSSGLAAIILSRDSNDPQIAWLTRPGGDTEKYRCRYIYKNGRYHHTHISQLDLSAYAEDDFIDAGVYAGEAR